ncbi:hypothetical protein LTR08_005045 [Meristemomyces frigidus]|nr:hypothetical protein LTR08_005045 [Meristemomyces frigidus]
MPIQPSPKKAGSFIGRVMGRRRRRSSVSLPNGHQISPGAQRSGGRKSSTGSQGGNAQPGAQSSSHAGEPDFPVENSTKTGKPDAVVQLRPLAGDRQTTISGGDQAPLQNGTIKSDPATPGRPPISERQITANGSVLGENGAQTGTPNITQNDGTPGSAQNATPTATHKAQPDDVFHARLNDTESSLEELTQVNSRGGVKWADGVEERRGSSQTRLSSVAPRRSSIFAKTAEGYHAEGVESGVGSKARRLSIHVPDALEVDECPLADHFSVISRMQKKHIGEGGAATVVQMRSKTACTGEAKQKVFAVKEFRDWDESEEDESEYQRKIKSEYAIAKACLHPNIVETYRLCYSEKRTKWHHVMEFCDRHDLVDIIKQNYFSREDRDCMFKQLLRGVDFLHSHGVAHRDLKAENLLLTNDGCLKIADFGTSEVFSGKHPGLQHCRQPSEIKENATIRYCTPGLVGSRPYMAPELLEHKNDYDPRCIDVWSCAIVYVTLIMEGNIWTAAAPDIKNYRLYADSWKRYLERYPDGKLSDTRPLPDFVDHARDFKINFGDRKTLALVLGMMNPYPEKRLSAHEALDCKTVMDMECCQQKGYSDDPKTRQRKVNHNNHSPPLKKPKGLK